MLTPILVIGCLLAGDPAGDTALKTKVLMLVHRLDADTEKERNDAEKQLIDLGSAILDMLPTPDPQATDNLAVRLRRIRQSLQDPGRRQCRGLHCYA